MSSSLPSIPIFLVHYIYHYFSEEHGYKNSKESRFDRRRILRAGRYLINLGREEEGSSLNEESFLRSRGPWYIELA